MKSMKRTRLLIVAVLMATCLISVGCQQVPGTSRRAGLVGLGGMAGAAAGHELGAGDPVKTGAGAVVGAGLTHLTLGKDPEVLQEGFDLGYVRGQSDAIKRQYFLRLSAEQQQPPGRGRGRVRTYLVPGPEQLPDGRVLAPHVIPVRVTE